MKRPYHIYLADKEMAAKRMVYRRTLWASGIQAVRDDIEKRNKETPMFWIMDGGQVQAESANANRSAWAVPSELVLIDGEVIE